MKNYHPTITVCVIKALCLFLFANTALSDNAVYEELGQLSAPEARQAVAVDDNHVYAIDNRAIAKYERHSGKKVASWSAPENSNIDHLNSGVVIEDKLYAAHSNYPSVPMVSSIEIWDIKDLQHVASRSFGIYEGSATWVDFHDGSWWVGFAQYENKGGVPGKGPEWTSIVQFDLDWVRLAGWVLPQAVIEEMAPYSNSGGAWGEDGDLYLTGHDDAIIYRTRLPQDGSRLQLISRHPAPIEGQGIAWDSSNLAEQVLFGLRRSSRTIVWAERSKH